MVACFRMKGDEIGTGVGELADQTIDRRHHEMHIDRRANPEIAQRLAHHRSDGEIGDEMIVHHIKVDQIRAGAEDRRHIVAEASEVGR